MGNAITQTVSFLFVCALLLASAAALGQVRSNPVAAGEIAPDFILPDQNGQQRTLSAERGKRPVVLVFYRGYW
jgi:cytochrome oxidase Cu insertion factor (SCO1/SenC/PrrC family)